jgi:hypothetical protein
LADEAARDLDGAIEFGSVADGALRLHRVRL